MCRCGSQDQVSEEDSGEFRCVLMCRLFRKVPESSGVCLCRFRRQVPEGSGAGSGRFWRVPACAGVGSGGKLRKVDSGRFRVCAHVIFKGRFRKVLESSGVCWYRFRR